MPNKKACQKNSYINCVVTFFIKNPSYANRISRNSLKTNTYNIIQFDELMYLRVDLAAGHTSCLQQSEFFEVVMDPICVLSIKIAPAEILGNIIFWSPTAESSNARRALEISGDLSRYCSRKMPNEWRKHISFQTKKNVSGPGWVQVSLYAAVSEQFEQINALNDYINSTRDTFGEACVVLDATRKLNPNSPGAVKILSGSHGVIGDAISAPQHVAEMANIIRGRCLGNSGSAIHISMGENSCDLNYTEPKSPILDDNSALVDYVGEISSVCDNRLIAGFNVHQGRSLTLSFATSIRESLVKSQLNRHLVLIRVREKIQYRRGESRVVGGVIEEFIGQMQDSIFE